MDIVVIGIGQSLSGDDAAGLEAVRLWQESHPDTAKRVRVELAELPGLGLLDLLAGVEAAVLVDAVQATPPAGTLTHLEADDLASFTVDARSAHGWGVAETLQMGCKLDPKLAQVRMILFGIAGRDFSMGAGLSPEVRGALAGVVEEIERAVLGLLAE
jgi:hydrogenase maturation protease